MVKEVPLVRVAPYRSGFQIGVVDTWLTQVAVEVQGIGTVDVLASGASLGAGPASLLVYAERGFVVERDGSLTSAAADAIARILDRDSTATVIRSTWILETANSRAAVFEVSLQSGSVFQVWAIVVSEVHSRVWVMIGTSSSGDANLYRVVFLASMKSSAIKWMSLL